MIMHVKGLAHSLLLRQYGLSLPGVIILFTIEETYLPKVLFWGPLPVKCFLHLIYT